MGVFYPAQSFYPPVAAYSTGYVMPMATTYSAPVVYTPVQPTPVRYTSVMPVSQYAVPTTPSYALNAYPAATTAYPVASTPNYSSPIPQGITGNNSPLFGGVDALFGKVSGGSSQFLSSLLSASGMVVPFAAGNIYNASGLPANLYPPKAPTNASFYGVGLPPLLTGAPYFTFEKYFPNFSHPVPPYAMPVGGVVTQPMYSGSGAMPTTS